MNPATRFWPLFGALAGAVYTALLIWLLARAYSISTPDWYTELMRSGGLFWLQAWNIMVFAVGVALCGVPVAMVLGAVTRERWLGAALVASPMPLLADAVFHQVFSLWTLAAGLGFLVLAWAVHPRGPLTEAA